MPERIKLKGTLVQSPAAMELLVQEITELKLRLKQSTNAMDKTLSAVRHRYEQRHAGLEKCIAEKSNAARIWAEANLEVFGGLKSLEFAHGIVGWRAGQPQLKTLGGWTWDGVLEKLKQAASLSGCVRTREEVNKQRLLGERERLGSEGLRRLGLRVVQEENFFVEPKLSNVENRIISRPGSLGAPASLPASPRPACRQRCRRSPCGASPATVQ